MESRYFFRFIQLDFDQNRYWFRLFYTINTNWYNPLKYSKDPIEVGGLMPILVTGTSQTGELMGFITGIKFDGFCSPIKNTKLLSKYGVEQIASGIYQ